jgi:hypothetical protein
MSAVALNAMRHNQVLIMVWDELLSTTSRITGKTSTGLMGTHDEDTYLYFKDYPNIGCIKVPRYSAIVICGARTL